MERARPAPNAKFHQRRDALARYLYDCFGAMTLQRERRWYRIPPAERQQWFDYADEIIRTLGLNVPKAKGAP